MEPMRFKATPVCTAEYESLFTTRKKIKELAGYLLEPQGDYAGYGNISRESEKLYMGVPESTSKDTYVEFQYGGQGELRRVRLEISPLNPTKPFFVSVKNLVAFSDAVEDYNKAHTNAASCLLEKEDTLQELDERLQEICEALQGLRNDLSCKRERYSTPIVFSTPASDQKELLEKEEA